MQSKTIIIGGGIAGMSCAMKLLAAKQDFLLITDVLGGRIMYSPEEKVNFGAYFIMNTYQNAKQIVETDSLLRPTDVCFHNSDTERFAVLDWRTLQYLPEFIRFFLTMREFSAHYEPYKKRCLTIPQKEALALDPYMKDIFSKPAAQFIREKNFEQVSSDYISKFTYACTGVSPEQITALDFLNVCMGMIVPIHRFKFDQKAFMDRLGNHLVIDTIQQIKTHDNAALIIGKSNIVYQADYVIIATPAVVTQQLLALTEIRSACKLFVYHVKADLKSIYEKYDMNLFPSTSEIILTAKQYDQSYLIYSREKDTDLNKVCKQFSLLSSMTWDNAMYVHGSAYIEQQYGQNIYVAGDHNGLGLEPAAISGIYAANQIINKECLN